MLFPRGAMELVEAWADLADRRMAEDAAALDFSGQRAPARVRAVIAESFERIHRSNLVMMGVLPLQFPNGKNAAFYGLTGEETFEIGGIATNLTPLKVLKVKATAPDKSVKEFNVVMRIDTPKEIEYYQHGGILPYVLRQILK
jgi:aconitate hydratase